MSEPPTDLLQLFSCEGEPRAMSYGAPLLLDDPNSAWLVAAGEVDLFITALSFGQPYGLRRFHMRLVEGDLFFGMDLPVTGESTGFLVASNATAKVERLPIERFATLVQEQRAMRKLEQWVRSLPNGLLVELPPPGAKELLQLTTLEAGEHARTEDPVLWIRPRGELEPLGLGDERIANEWYPLAAEGWVSATEKVEVEALTTREYARASRSLSALRSFHRVALAAAGRFRAREEASERARMTAKERADSAAMSAAISRLAAVADVDHGRRADDDPLSSACRLVGRAIGLEIQSPPESKRVGDPDERLQAITRASRVRTRQVLLRAGWWRTDSGPLLAYRDDGAPLAMLPVGPGRYDCVDPADGKRTRVGEQIAETLRPFAVTFYRPFASRALAVSDVVSLALAGTKQDLKVVAMIGVIGGAFELILPLATGQIFDRIIPSSDRDLLLQMTLAIIALAVANMLLSFARGVAMLRVETRMGFTVQAAVWDRLLSLPAPFFRRFSSGDLAARANGVEVFQGALSSAAITTLLSSIFAVWNLVLIFWIDARLASIASGLILSAGGAVAIAGLVRLRFERRISEIRGRISGFLIQLVDGIAKLRVANAEVSAFAVWSRETAAQRTLKAKSGGVANGLAAFDALFPIVASAIIFAGAASETAHLSTGEFLAFNVAFFVFLQSFLRLITAGVGLLEVVPELERTRPILESVPEIDPHKEHPGNLNGDIELNQLSFRYTPDQPMVVDRVSLRIRPNELVAIVGPSGSGKSTLLRLLLGFEKPSSGAIYYSGQDLANLDLREVRRQLGVVLQNGRVMGGTIRDNVEASRALTNEEIWRALERAALAEDVREMPMQLQTFVGPGGEGLSGGQRQRLLIARAIGADPRILFLDEATSALDNATQAIVTESLHRLGVTRLVIAHRLSTIREADRILVLDRGSIVQEGTYEELMAVPGPFRELAERQLV